MPGLSHTLDVASRALATQQSVMSVLGHNVANANTEGYTRQIPHTTAIAPSPWEVLSFGNGVELTDVQRKRDGSLDNELRRDMSELGRWSVRGRRLSRLEAVLNEPSDGGLSASMDAYWNAWSDLSNDPSSITRRSTVKEQGEILAYRFNTLVAQVGQIIDDTDTEIRIRTDEFNLQLGELRELNTMIAESRLRGMTPNDLLDRKDMLLDNMSELAGVTYGDRENGSFYLRLGTVLILDENTFRPLQAVQTNSETAGSGIHFELENLGGIELDKGMLGGLMEVRSDTIPDTLAQIDELATSIIENVNSIHRTGPSRIDFFSGSGASDMALSADIQDNLANLNSSTSGLPGDNDVAIAISDLRNRKILNDNNHTPAEYWNSVVGHVGIINREAQFQEEGFSLTTEALEQERASQSGVSLDEEMGNIIIAQQAYMAAVKLYEIAAEMMDALLAI
jgi:flagellar hook-associated protein 1